MGKKKSKSSQQVCASTENKTSDILTSDIIKNKNATVTAETDLTSHKADSTLASNKKDKATSKNKKSTLPSFGLKEIKTFKALPVLIDSPIFTKDLTEASQHSKQVLHYLYFKAHQPRENTSEPKIIYEADNSQLLPPGRTLFATNLPVDCSEKDLTELFNNYKLAGPGQVIKVLIRAPNSLSIDLKLNSSGKNQDDFVKKTNTALAREFSELFPSLNTTGKGLNQTLLTYPNYAYIVFKKTESLEKILNYKLQLPTNNTEEKLDLESFLINSPSSFLSLNSSITAATESGMKRWLHRYDVQRPDPKKLQAYLDEYMGEYNHHTELVKYRESLTMDMPDEDGFVKVVKGRTRNATADGATVRAILKADAKELSIKIAADKRRQEQKEADGTALNFYRIQTRDSKKQRLAQLRTQFEEDKKRISEMKQRNQFRLS